MALSLAGICSLFAPTSHAQMRPNGLYAAVFTEHAGPGTIEVPFGSSTARARLGRRMSAATSQSLVAVNNANGTYRYSAAFRGRGCPEQTVLLLDGVAMPIASSGRSNGECRYDFNLDRAHADRAARAFGIPREDRSPHGERVTAHFRSSAEVYRAGATMEVRITFGNPADAPAVQREVGCVRFAIVVFRDGHRVASLEPGASACPVGFAPLAAGATAQDSVDVGRWGNLTTPGHYRLECSYVTNFAAAGVATFGSPSYSAVVWQRSFTGIVDFDLP